MPGGGGCSWDYPTVPVHTSAAARMGRRSAEQFVRTGIPRKCPFDLYSPHPMVRQLVVAYGTAFSATPDRAARPGSPGLRRAGVLSLVLVELHDIGYVSGTPHSADEGVGGGPGTKNVACQPLRLRPSTLDPPGVNLARLKRKAVREPEVGLQPAGHVGRDVDARKIRPIELARLGNHEVLGLACRPGHSDRLVVRDVPKDERHRDLLTGVFCGSVDDGEDVLGRVRPAGGWR